MNMQPQRSYTTHYLGMDLAEGESTSARQWHDADNNLICYATEYEVHEVARFFGYTPEQFDALRAKIQVGMVNDHRRQMKEKGCYPDEQDSPAITFKQALFATLILCLLVGIFAFCYR